MQKTTYHMSEKPEISLQTFEVGLVMAAVMMRVTAVTLIIPFPVTPSDLTIRLDIVLPLFNDDEST